jgi:hypothetical protein
MYILDSRELKKLVLEEVHTTPYLGHPRVSKMITKLKTLYFWPRLKKDVVEYVARYLECQQVKVEHTHLVELLYPHDIPEY